MMRRKERERDSAADDKLLEAASIQEKHQHSELIHRAVMMFMELLESEAKEMDNVQD